MIKLDRFNIKENLINELIQEEKYENFLEFLQRLPNGNVVNVIQNWFDIIFEDNSLINDFKINLWSINKIEDLNYNHCTIPICALIFDKEPKGFGRGELMLAFILYDSKINGGSEDFDLFFNNKKYEIKDYSNSPSSSAIRLGTAGKVTRFKFWKEILYFIDNIKQIFETYKSFDIFGEEIAKDLMYFSNRSFLTNDVDIRSGEFNKKDIETFIRVSNNIKEFTLLKTKNINGYTKVIFTGPNVNPIEFNIKSVEDIEKEKIFIVKEQNKDSIIDTIYQLKTLRYVYKPELFIMDLENAVDDIINNFGGEFIIFRKNKIIITNKFNPCKITQGSLKIIERQ